MFKKQTKKQLETQRRAFNVLNLIGNALGLILLFVFVFIASFLLIAYFKEEGGFDILEVWRAFYAAF